jgi:phosphoenolpyruvate carboxykinase (ATP)
VATFSSCFGAAFMVWESSVYANLLADKIKQHNTKVWLINTGWVGGGYGVGNRIDLAYTRAIIAAIHGNQFEDIVFTRFEFFDIEIPTFCPNVPTNILNPIEAWPDANAYIQQAKKLKDLFDKNSLK